MPERPAPCNNDDALKETACVHTKKIYDACRDKDCLEDLRVFPTKSSQQIIDTAINIKCRRAELLWVFIDVEAVPFNRGFFSVDIRCFYRIVLDAYTGVCKPTEVTGLATFDKRVILFGSEGNAKVFDSKTALNDCCDLTMRSANLPTAVVEAVDPICLNARLFDTSNPLPGSDYQLNDVPESIADCFDDVLVYAGDKKRVFVSLGQFSIVRLERDTQLVIPSYDFCLPEKECVGSTEDSPCDLFRRIKFPVDEFLPPNVEPFEEYRDIQFNYQR